MHLQQEVWKLIFVLYNLNDINLKDCFGNVWVDRRNNVTCESSNKLINAYLYDVIDFEIK